MVPIKDDHAIVKQTQAESKRSVFDSHSGYDKHTTKDFDRIQIPTISIILLNGTPPQPLVCSLDLIRLGLISSAKATT